MLAAEFEPVVDNGRRRSPRAPVSLDARLGRGGLDRTLCKITDLSRHGIRLQTYSTVRSGSLIWLTMPAMAPRAARVVRSDEFEAGCEFLEPLAQDQFEALVALDGSLDRTKEA